MVRAKTRILLIFFIFSVFISKSLYSTGEGEASLQRQSRDHLARLFAKDEVLELEIRGPISTIRRDRGKKKKYHPVTIVYFDKDLNKEVSLAIEIRTRGHFRRNPRICNFPPLKIRFLKGKKGTVFAKQKTLKLVAQCQTKNNNYQQYLFGEYLVYKFYSLFTPRSLSVRLARITYVEQGKKPLTRYAFFIENIKSMARRNGLKHFEYKEGQNFVLNLTQRSLVAVFQFMVGNTDWAKFGDHNIIFLTSAHSRGLISVPYDFDFCGIVNAHYAGPTPESGIKSFQDRVFQGYCRSRREFQQIFDRFRAKRDTIYSMVEKFPQLTPAYKEYARKYLDKFFEIINNPKKINRYFIKGCRKIR